MITEEIKIIANTQEAETNIKKLDNSLDNLNSTNASVSQGMKESTTSVLDNGGAMGLLNMVTGGYAQIAKDSVEAMGLFAKESKIATFAQTTYSMVVGASTGAMKLFRIALASTGIGLIVLALVSLVLNFSKVTDAVTKLIPALKIVTDFFKNVIQTVTDFVGITSEAEREMESFNAQAEKSLELNKKYIQQRGDLLDEFTKKKIEAKNNYLKAMQEESLSDKDRYELGLRLNRDLDNANKDRDEKKAKDKKTAQDKLDSIQKGIDDKEKSRRDKLNSEAVAIEKKRVDEIMNERKKLFDASARFQDEQETIDITRRVKKEEFDKGAMDREIESRQKGAELGRKLLEDESEYEKQLAQNVKTAKLSIASNTLSLISEIAGKGSKIGKATAVAQATISGYEGVQNAFTTASKSPITTVFPAYPFIQAGLAGAFSALQIKNILKTNSGGMTAPSSSGGVPAPTAPSFNLVQGTGSNQVANSISQQNRPIQAYVVSTNVTTAQSLDRNIIANSTLG